MSRGAIEATLRKSPRGDWIATAYVPPTTPKADRCRGWYCRRFATIELASEWLGNVVENISAKRARYRERMRTRQTVA